MLIESVTNVHGETISFVGGYRSPIMEKLRLTPMTRSWEDLLFKLETKYLWGHYFGANYAYVKYKHSHFLTHLWSISQKPSASLAPYGLSEEVVLKELEKFYAQDW